MSLCDEQFQDEKPQLCPTSSHIHFYDIIPPQWKLPISGNFLYLDTWQSGMLERIQERPKENRSGIKCRAEEK